MQLKTGRFGPYFACTSCENTRKVLRMVSLRHRALIQLKWNIYAQPNTMISLCCVMVQQVCLAASKFPKVRETRCAESREMRTVAEQLDPKYQFILQAPDADPEGNLTLVKFSRKNQAQIYWFGNA